MKNRIIGLLSAFLPIYSFITWIMVFNNPSLKNQAERLSVYHETYFFNVAFNTVHLGLLNLFLIAVSIYFISKEQLSGQSAIFKNLYLGFLIFIAVYNIWGLL